MAKTAVVILNWNGRDFLKKFLPILIENTQDADIIVADNASSDDSIELLKSEFKSVQLIELDQNYGFCGGYNRALNSLDHEYFVLLNSDVEVSKAWLKPLTQILDENDEIAAVQPKLLDFNNRALFEYAGAAGGYIDRFGYPFCKGRVFFNLEEDKGQYDSRNQIFWATGACLCIRSSVYKELGGLDELFFAHMEEIDLCWRINNSGKKIYYEPSSVVYHVGGGTLHKSNPRKTFLNYRNGLFLLYKNLHAQERDSIIFKRMMLDGLSGIKMLLSFEFSNFLAVIRAHNAFRKEKGQLELSGNTLIKERPLIYKKSIVWQYFIRGKKIFTELDFLKNPK